MREGLMSTPEGQLGPGAYAVAPPHYAALLLAPILLAVSAELAPPVRLRDRPSHGGSSTAENA